MPQRVYAAVALALNGIFVGGRYGVYSIPLQSWEFTPILTLAFFTWWALGDVITDAKQSLGAFESFLLSVILASVAGSLAPISNDGPGSIAGIGGGPYHPLVTFGAVFSITLASAILSMRQAGTGTETEKSKDV